MVAYTSHDPLARQSQATDLLDHHRAVEKVRPEAAVLFRQVRTQHALLPRLVPERAVDVALLLPLCVKRGSFLFENSSRQTSAFGYEGFDSVVDKVGSCCVGLDWTL